MTLTTPVTDDHSTPPRLVTTTTPASAGRSGSTWFSATASSTKMTGRRPFDSARYRTRRSTRVAGTILLGHAQGEEQIHQRVISRHGQPAPPCS